MKNCDNLFLTGQTEYENIHKMCSDAYTKGRMTERTLAIEAYRLRWQQSVWQQMYDTLPFRNVDQKNM